MYKLLWFTSSCFYLFHAILYGLVIPHILGVVYPPIPNFCSSLSVLATLTTVNPSDFVRERICEYLQRDFVIKQC